MERFQKSERRSAVPTEASEACKLGYKGKRHNPNAFDNLTEWILDDSEWTEDKLKENEQILMQGILSRFRSRNAQLRAYLKELEPAGVVNEAVFNALDRFDAELSGKTECDELRVVISKMFTDFSCMRDRKIRELIAGGKTGPTGADSVEVFGYVNLLKVCDARVQWILFMPGVVEKQQKAYGRQIRLYENARHALYREGKL